MIQYLCILWRLCSEDGLVNQKLFFFPTLLDNVSALYKVPVRVTARVTTPLVKRRNVERIETT